jgi:hypothetical protein
VIVAVRKDMVNAVKYGDVDPRQIKVQAIVIIFSNRLDKFGTRESLC